MISGAGFNNSLWRTFHWMSSCDFYSVIVDDFLVAPQFVQTVFEAVGIGPIIVFLGTLFHNLTILGANEYFLML